MGTALGPYSMRLPLFSLLSASASLSSAWNCGDFQEGACDLSESNILAYDRHTASPGECQDKCRAHQDCSSFTHFSSQCYLLKQCGNMESCGGCTSGPQEPDIDTCPWPPSPDTTTRRTSTKSTTTASTTTPTTTTKRTTTKRTTTTAEPGNCNDFHVNELCDWSYGLVAEFSTIMTGRECQTLCRAVPGAVFFSHYNHGDNGHKGECGCLSSCSWPGKFHCHSTCSDDDDLVRDDDGHDCHCMRGPLSPDVNNCDLFP